MAHVEHVELPAQPLLLPREPLRVDVLGRGTARVSRARVSLNLSLTLTPTPTPILTVT